MGQTSSTPSDRWPYFLIFTTDKYDLDNNTLTCEELGIRYRIYTPPVARIFALTDDRVTSIYRWDSKAQREILIAEVEKRSHKQRMRIAPGTGLDAPGINVPFVPAKEYFPNTSGWSKTKRIFRASNGKEYIWRVYDGTLYPSDDKSEPIAKFGHADILDELVVTCLIAENERIEQDAARNAHRAGPGGH
ncbi:hypothetical protein A7U60_g1463 [Sanghuangporus baumii]|uniref:DUF6593 domain-containing protein n=1 Tax=Sanghuangporus baumii TaxID=108892 RepID=A0A9Q5I4C1_SANBA|nr:hypothetical protein A7U60_g1463 [Sanghuangporus baumii]